MHTNPQSEPVTREVVIANTQQAFENLLHLLPETVAYHLDTKVTVEELPHESGKQIRFILDVIVIDTESAHE